MINLTKTLFCLAMAVHVVSAGLFWTKVNPGKKVNEFLVKLLPENQDLDQNLKAASDWKQELNNDPKADHAIVEGLSTLEALHLALKNPKCNKEMYETVDKSAKFVGWECFLNQVDDSDLLRTQFIVRYAARQIAKVCHEQNKAQLDQRLKSLDAKEINRAAGLTQMCYATEPFGYEKDVCNVNLRDTIKRDLPGLVMTILNRMKFMSSDLKYLRLVNNELGQKVVKEDKVRELIKQFVLEPCRYLVKEIGDIITLAYRDSVYMQAFSGRRWMLITKSPFDTLVPTYCLCNIFISAGDERVVQQAIVDVPYARDSSLENARRHYNWRALDGFDEKLMQRD